MNTSIPAGTGQPGPEDPTGQDQGSPLQGPRSGRSERRTFTSEFKGAVVQEYDAAPNGAKGAVLRRAVGYLFEPDKHINITVSVALDDAAARGTADDGLVGFSTEGRSFAVPHDLNITIDRTTCS